MYSCFDNPQAVISQAFENLAPGGWVEYMEICPDISSFDGSHEGEFSSSALFVGIIVIGAYRGLKGSIMQEFWNLCNDALIERERYDDCVSLQRLDA